MTPKDQNIIIDVEETFKHIEEVCRYLDDEEGWNVDCSNETVTTKYKKYPNSNSYMMKLEGELNFPIENMCSIVYEIEYFNEFIPFCGQSYTVNKLRLIWFFICFLDSKNQQRRKTLLFYARSAIFIESRSVYQRFWRRQN